MRHPHNGQVEAGTEGSLSGEEQFRLFYECSPLAYQSLDGDGLVLNVNPAWLDLFGYQRNQVRGRSFTDFLTPGFRGAFPERFARFTSVGKVTASEWEVVSRGGRTICIELDARASYDGNGSFLRSHCVLRDVTERKLAERLTQTLAQAALDLLDLSPETDLFQYIASQVQTFVGKGIVAVNAIEGDTLRVRSIPGASKTTIRLAEKLMGHSVVNFPFDGVHERARRDLMTGRLLEVEGGLYELFFRTVPRPICFALEKAVGLRRCYSIGIRHGGTLFGNVTLLCQDGTVLDSGMIEVFVNQASIALEQRRDQKALRESEQKHRLLLTHAPLGIGYYDMEGRVIMLNEAAAAHMRGKPVDFIGKTLEQMYGATRGSLYSDRIREAAERKTSRTYEDCVELPTGEKWFRSTYAALTGTDGKVLGVQIISDEVTQLKEAEQELQTAHLFLRTVLDSFPGNVAVLDADGTIVMFNKAWRSFGLANGLAPKWLDEGINYLDICRQANGRWSNEAPQVVQAVEAILTGRRDRFEIEYPCHSPDQKRWFSLQAQGFTYEGAQWAVLAHVDITSRVQAERAMRESQRKFRVVTETIQDVFWMSTPGVAEQCYVSPAYEAIWGRSTEELHGNPRAFLDAVHPADHDRLVDCIETNHAQGRQYRCEYRIVRPDGQIRWILERGYPVIEAGVRQTMAGVCTDITEHKDAEMLLAREAAMHEALLDSIPNCFAMILKKDSREIVASNRSAREIGAVPGKTCFNMCAQHDDACPFCLSPVLWESGQPQRLEVEYRGAWYEGIWVPLSDDLYVHYVFDITERKLSEATLHKSEKKYRTVVENAKEGILVIQEGKRVYYNRRWLELTGYTASEYEKKPFLSLIDPKDQARAAKLYDDLGEARGPGDSVEFRLVTRSGRVLCLDAQATKIEWENQPAVMVFLEDVTQRRKAQAKLDAYQKQLQSLATESALARERERRRIGLGLHDHVGQSLAMTKLAVQSLAGTIGGQTAEALKGICDQIDGQIEAIRSLSFELNDSVLYEVGFKEAVDAYLHREVQGKHGISYRLVADEGFGPLPDGVKMVLFRNLRELLTNVLKHAQAKHVDIGLTTSDALYTVTVRDDGIGFTPAAILVNHEHEHFGLFSVREQLGFFGGRLEVQSVQGHGTTATLTLPRKSVV